MWYEVTRTRPCLICGKPDWCSITDDGTWAVCRRVDNGQGTHKVDKAGMDYWLYKLTDGPRTPPPELPARQESERADAETLHQVYCRLLAELTLSPEHRKNLRKRGLSDEEIDRRGYRSLPVRGRSELARRLLDTFDPETLARVPGFYIREEGGRQWWSLAGPAGLVIPCRDIQGRIVALKVRSDNPDEERGKYVYVSSKNHGGPGPGAPVHHPIFDGSIGDIVRITEGELKADIATTLSGILTISVPGVSCWRPVIPALKALGAKQVLLAFDADWKVNQHVRRALHRAAGALVKEGFEIMVETWPLEQGKGIDDLLAAGNKPKTLQVAVKAKADPKGKPRNKPLNGPAEGEDEWQPRVAWPDPPRPEAFHGLAGDFVRAVEPHTEADPVALLSQFQVMYGNIIGRTAYFEVEADRHYLNEFLGLVGPTAKARKGTSLGQVRRIFRAVDPEWEKKRVLTGLASGEGLKWHVRDPIEKEQPIYEEYGGKKELVGVETFIVDPGVKDKRLLAYEPEFASTLRVLGREGNTLSAAIREAWDSGNLGNLTKNDPVTATGAHISIIAHITKQELLRFLDSTEAGNGFGNRFLWICVRRSKLLPEGGRIGDVDFAPLVKRLTAAVEFGRNMGELKRDAEAAAWWRKVYPALSEGKPGLLGAILARAEAHVMRLACIYALLDLSPVVRAEHLQAALALWDYCERSARFIFGDALGDPLADEILRLLRAAPNGLTKTEIYEHFGRNRSAAQINRALGSLLEFGLVQFQKEKTGRRPREGYAAAKTQVYMGYELNELNEELRGSSDSGSDELRNYSREDISENEGVM
ncbi:MAG: DUF3854 domain-containing protein [Syntrophothermus sp.]|uniref:DUF3854 domain-containing protein n=1 Tax=Syntrophothermus sp. TaxID=2736299 RepID=UPI00257CD31C|nr:DUF3854 domain-containing protein [Syntrophothermus sp.]NSW84278.1 DUF3854 domain-containing protein [Syntrophothermus sp.]